MVRSRLLFPSLVCACVVGLFACAGPPASRAGAQADLVLVGGRVVTMDAANPQAQAIAVASGRIVAVGTDQAIRAHIGPRTRVITLRGRQVTPGLVDGHAHLLGLGRSLENLALRGVSSPDHAAAQVTAIAATRPEGEWILGRGWDQNLFPGKQFPDHTLLTRAAPRHPVALRRVDGHAVWLNALALARAGIGPETQDPAGGRIVRDASGKPTGILVDNAMDLVDAQLPPASQAAVARQVLAAQDVIIAAGLTGIHDMGVSLAELAVYRSLAAQGKLRIRVQVYLSGSEGLAALRALGRPMLASPDDRLQVRGVKLFADGALGSRGAALLEPYSDASDTRGLTLTSEADLRAMAAWATDSGWQLASHAIGDAANRMMLDIYEDALRGRPAATHRFRIEHAQVVSPADLPRFARSGIIASMQPTHCTSDMPWAESRLGSSRVQGAYAWRTLLDSGALLVAGSDFPVEEVAPLDGLYSAVTRADKAGHPSGGWWPAQRMTLEEALAAFTVAPAYAGFAEDHRGRIRPGFAADFTVFDRPLAADVLLDTKIDLTIVAGEILYQREAQAP